MKCERPGCEGTIIDGYCNECGMAPSAEARSRTGTGTDSGSEARSGASSSRFTSPPSAATGSPGTRRSGPTRPTRRSNLGAGLVEIPPITSRDPTDAIILDPQVPENRRFCAGCDEPVGRSREGRPGRTEGFCPKCRHPFSFTPKLSGGDLVGGQYEVVGCLAHGGLGWIYLARDHKVEERWVVLKGLLDADDESAKAVALAERRSLAEVEHPNIVKIINFVEHDDAGYIVMEYVGGSSLKELLKQRREANAGNADPLPVDEAIAYTLEVLSAFGYLHNAGLLFCDLKPDNVIQTGDAIKLIDLGSVRRVDDQVSPVYGTVGYQAPEIGDLGPSVRSDLFTVGRMLAVLAIDFKHYQGRYKYTIPPQRMIPVFERFDPLYRFLVKATAPDPDARFQSAGEMADQLLGILREVVAAKDGRPRPAVSTLFTGDLRARPDAADWKLLPIPLVAADDPAAGFLLTVNLTDPDDAVTLLRAAPMDSVEIDLSLARALLEVEDFEGLDRVLNEVETRAPWEWRVSWYRGLADLADGQAASAVSRFDAVYGEAPGELAPKLALGLAHESSGSDTVAAPWYDAVSRTDPGFTTAVFGLARCRLASAKRTEAVEAYHRIPETSASYIDAQIGAARALLGLEGDSQPGMTELSTACATVTRLPLDPEQTGGLTRDILTRALDLLDAGLVEADPDVTVMGEPFTEAGLRSGLERAYRSLARIALTRDERIRLIDLANEERPRTLV
jgi:serine/threonine-protein kinase PknG